MKNCKVLFVTILLIVVSFFVTVNPVKADMGPKPSITVKLVNMDTTDYIIDLLVYDEDGSKFQSPANYNGDGLTEEQIEKLHSINYDGWISEGTRWSAYLLFADCAGNDEFVHTFSYFGTPYTYKVVIINNKTGEVKLSETITRNVFNSEIELDVSKLKSSEIINGQTISVLSPNSLLSTDRLTIKNVAIVLVITIVVELLIALIMGVKNYKTILLVNILTNIIAQLLMIFGFVRSFKYYLIMFFIGEVLVLVAEYLLYKKFFKNVTNKKILLYTFVANVVTALLTYIIPTLV